MKKVVPVLVLLVVLVLAMVPAQADEPVEAPKACEVQLIPWGAASPTVQPMGFPFMCCRCRVCANPFQFTQYTVCNCGYFDGCSGGYPSCRRPYHISLWKTCDCP